MFAVNDKKAGRTRNSRPAESSGGDDMFVLPRPLRRTVRFIACLVTGRIHIPEHTGTLSAAAFFAAMTLYGMSLGGHTRMVAQVATTAAGFAIEDVRVSGNSETSEIEILQLLGLDGTTSLVALDIDAAREKLSHLPWVQDAEVRKVYPRTIEVKLRERAAYGIWQHGAELSLIEKDGSVIAPLRDNKFAALPLFVGQGAEKEAARFEDRMKSWPEIKDRVKAYVRVANRRWDLHLDNGVIIKLPEHDVPRALTALTTLDAEQNLLARDIAAVDLRLPDRTTVRLTPGAAERRQLAVDARAKEFKKAGKQI